MNKQFSGYETIASGYSNNMYLPHAPLDEWTLDELRRALCAKANGDVLACEECENRCRYGRRIVELLKPVEMEKEEKTVLNQDIAVANPVKVDGRSKNGERRREQAENDYLQAIASGNPRQWFIDHGRDVRNGMSRMKKRFPGMTAGEAQARLGAKEIAVECAKVELLNAAPAEVCYVRPDYEGMYKEAQKQLDEANDKINIMTSKIRDLRKNLEDCRTTLNYTEAVFSMKAEMYENLYKDLLKQCLTRGEAK